MKIERLLSFGTAILYLMLITAAVSKLTASPTCYVLGTETGIKPISCRCNCKAYKFDSKGRCKRCGHYRAHAPLKMTPEQDKQLGRSLS